MTFGEKLQKLRTRAGLSQDQLAELLDVSRQAVSKWERNEAMPEVEKLVRISRQFGVSTDYLLLEELEEPETANTTAPAAGDHLRVNTRERDVIVSRLPAEIFPEYIDERAIPIG